MPKYDDPGLVVEVEEILAKQAPLVFAGEVRHDRNFDRKCKLRVGLGAGSDGIWWCLGRGGTWERMIICPCGAQ